MKYLVLALALFAASVQAEVTVGLHLASVHTEDNYNNDNLGGYVKVGNIVVGSYYNSVRRQSTYAAYVWQMGPVAIATGLITGYRNEAVPLIAPSVAYHGVRLTVIPQVPGVTKVTVMHLSLEHTF